MKKKHGRLQKKKETLIYIAFEHIYSFKTLIYYEKSMVLWNKNMVLWKKTMVLWKKLWYYSKL